VKIQTERFDSLTAWRREARRRKLYVHRMYRSDGVTHYYASTGPVRGSRVTGTIMGHCLHSNDRAMRGGKLTRAKRGIWF
jgi:hypothetical protein